MNQPVALADRLAVLRDALPAFEGLGEVLHQACGPELASIVSLFDSIASEGARARTATVAEAVRRDEVGPTLMSWIRANAPSLQQGGAGQTARLVTEATKGRPFWTGEGADPDPDSPIGIVWDAVTETAAAEADGEIGSDPAGEAIDRSGEEATEMLPPILAPLTPVNALAVLSEMRALKKRLRPEAVPTVTKILVELAREWGPAHMRRLRPRLLADYGLEGELDDLQAKLAPGAYLSSPEVESGELTEYRMAMTPAQAAALEAAIGPLSKPVPNPVTGEKDHRPAGQRRVEALTDLCQQSLATQLAAGGEGVTGAYAAVHVNLNLEDLRSLTGCVDAMSAFGAPVGEESTVSLRPETGFDRDLFTGEVFGSTAQGTLLSPARLRQLACAAHLIPHVLGSKGEHLDQGEEVRLFNKAQRRKLLRRDKHCTYPGCDRPGAWTRAHHVLHWFDDGWSDIDNGALLCEHHHTVVHARRLWADVRSTPDDDGRYVVWDLTNGSYDRELERRRADRAMQDPPPMPPKLTPKLWEELAAEDLAWEDLEPLTAEEAELGRQPLIWDDVTHTFLTPHASPVPAA